MTTVRELLNGSEAVHRFFDGQNLDDTVRLSQNAGTVDVIVEAPKEQGQDGDPAEGEQHS